MDHYYPGKPQVLPRPDPSASARLQQYAGTYEMSRHNYVRFEKSLNPPFLIGITVMPNGTLRITSSVGTAEYVEVSPGVFSQADGKRPATGDVVFHTAADGTVDFFMYTNIAVFVFDRVPWYAMAEFFDGLKTVAGIILASVLFWPLLVLFRRMHAIPEPSVPKPATIARWIAGSAALVLIVFAFVLVPWITADEALILVYLKTQTVPATLTAVLTLPVIAALLTLATMVFTVIAWKERYWTRLHRVHYTLITAALIAMLWWVNYNNLWVFCL
jgi:hypothetical protein